MNNNVHLLNINIQSLTNKLNSLEMILHTNNIDFACITEHWLGSDMLNACVINGFSIGSAYCRKVKKHGGAMILIKEGISFIERSDLKEISVEMDIEIAAIELKSSNTLIVSLYRSPNGDFNNFLDGLCSLLEIIEEESWNKSVFVCGDFNVNFLESTINRDNLTSLFMSYKFHHTMSQPSRICKTSQSCIDNIFTNINEDSYHAETVNLHISDHLAQILIYRDFANKPGNKNKNKCEIKPVRIINEQNIYAFKRELQLIHWQPLLSGRSGMEMSSVFYKVFTQLFEKSFPERNVQIKSNSKMHYNISDEVKRMKSILDALSIVAKVTQNQEGYDLYNNLKNDYKKVIDREIRNSHVEYITNSDNKQKSIWELIKRNTKSCPKINCKMNITPDELNAHFAAVDTVIATSLESADKLLYNTKKFNEKSCYFEPVTPNEILQISQKIKTKSTLDHYGISTKLLKDVIEFLMDPLVLIINTCIQEGVYPKELKCAKVIPIHKKDDVNDANNYRPISILPSVSKIFEHVILKRLLIFFKKFNILNNSQHGYRENKSTITAIEDVMQCILDALDNNKHIELTCFDLSKAFDSVNHQILLSKLYYYGIRGNIHDLLKSYLEDRQQYVYFNDRTSKIIEMKRGVPQGSILGPLLFLIYVNDLEPSLSAEKVCLYADDTSTLASHDEKSALVTKTNKILQEAEAWFTANQLTLNTAKTQSLEFTTKKDQRTKSIKFLGMQIDNKLCWKEHIDSISKKLSTAIYSVRRIKGISTFQAARMTYFANFHSLATYGIQFWGMSTDADRVFMLQKRVIRVLNNLRQWESCRRYFVSNGILTIPSAYILTIARYVHVNKDLYAKNSDTHNYPTRNQCLLRAPYHRLTTTQKYVDFWGVKVYNKLPKKMCELHINKFTKELKKLLLQNAYYSVEEFLKCSLT